jgi:hypothetical protein
MRTKFVFISFFAFVLTSNLYADVTVLTASDADKNPTIAASNFQERYEEVFNKNCKDTFTAVGGKESLFHDKPSETSNWSKKDYTTKYGDLNNIWSDQKIKFNTKLATFKKETDANKRKTMWGDIDQLLYFMKKSCDHFKIEFDRQVTLAKDNPAKKGFFDKLKGMF